MTATPSRPVHPAVRLLVLTLLAAAWLAVLVWLWTEEASTASCFEYAPLTDASSADDSCAEAIERDMRRYDGWFLVALISGPVVGVALWFVLRPKHRR